MQLLEQKQLPHYYEFIPRGEIYYKMMVVCDFVVLPSVDQTQSGTLARIIALNKPYVTTAPMEGLTAQTIENKGGLMFTNKQTLREAVSGTGRLFGRVMDRTSLLESARLVTLRGIGAYHVSVLRRSGISSVCELSAASADELWADIHARIDGRFRPTEAEVRVGIRAANDRKIKGPMACEGSGD